MGTYLGNAYVSPLVTLLSISFVLLLCTVGLLVCRTDFQGVSSVMVDIVSINGVWSEDKSRLDSIFSCHILTPLVTLFYPGFFFCLLAGTFVSLLLGGVIVYTYSFE